MIELEYGTIYCRHCNETYYYKSTILRGGFDGFKPVKCPKCKSELGNVRADLHLALLGSKPGEQMQFNCELGAVDLNNVDELIGAMKVVEMLEIEIEGK